MEKIGKWCFVTDNTINYSNKTNMKIAFVMVEAKKGTKILNGYGEIQYDCFLGYPLEDFGNILNSKIELMFLNRYKYIKELSKEEIQKLISFGHNKKILKNKKDETLFEKYWALFYSPSSNNFQLALRYSSSPRDVKNNILWTERFYINEYICTIINDVYKSINRQHKYIDKFACEAFSQKISVDSFQKLIKMFEDNDFTFDLLKKERNDPMLTISEKVAKKDIPTYKAPIEVRDLNYLDLVPILLSLSVDKKIIKYYQKDILKFLFRRKSKDIFEYRDVLTNETSLIDISDVRNIIK